ncbi:MAG: preprotein translocase subunit SecE [Candidatus Sumerlaeaceae bacterium]|jgi:preprotein translocase subunit SecE
MEETKQKGKLRRFIDEVIVELKKVTWPSKRELYGATMVVITVIILLTIGVGVVDFLISRVMSLLIRIGT